MTSSKYTFALHPSCYKRQVKSDYLQNISEVVRDLEIMRMGELNLPWTFQLPGKEHFKEGQGYNLPETPAFKDCERSKEPPKRKLRI